MRDATLNELNEGLMEQFRIVRNRDGEMELEMRIADTMANVAGKVLKSYMVELAYNAMKQPMPCQISEIAKIGQSA